MLQNVSMQFVIDQNELTVDVLDGQYIHINKEYKG